MPAEGVHQTTSSMASDPPPERGTDAGSVLTERDRSSSRKVVSNRHVI